MTREKSIASAARNLLSSSWCKRSHTPAACQSRSLRQHVMPEPQPISRGSISQGMPERSTNKMPHSAWRSETGGRPGRSGRRGAERSGSNGSISFQSSSSMIGLAISSAQVTRRQRLTALQ